MSILLVLGRIFGASAKKEKTDYWPWLSGKATAKWQKRIAEIEPAIVAAEACPEGYELIMDSKRAVVNTLCNDIRRIE